MAWHPTRVWDRHMLEDEQKRELFFDWQKVA